MTWVDESHRRWRGGGFLEGYKGKTTKTFPKQTVVTRSREEISLYRTSRIWTFTFQLAHLLFWLNRFPSRTSGSSECSALPVGPPTVLSDIWQLRGRGFCLKQNLAVSCCTSVQVAELD